MYFNFKKASLVFLFLAVLAIILSTLSISPFFSPEQLANPQGTDMLPKGKNVNAQAFNSASENPFSMQAVQINDEQIESTLKSTHQNKRIENRRKKMFLSGYATPPNYDEMSLKTLIDLAKKRDVYALLQLGEQYAFEPLEIRNQPEFDSSQTSKSIGIKYFSDAVAAGHIRMARVISKMFLEDRNLVDAYAWNLVSERLGDTESVKWFQSTWEYQSLTQNQKSLAYSKLPALLTIAMQRFVQTD